MTLGTSVTLGPFVSLGYHIFKVESSIPTSLDCYEMLVKDLA